MRIPAALAMAAALAAGAQAPAKARVCVNSGVYAPVLVLARARYITSRMFATAGVDIEWRMAGAATCKGFEQSQTVILDFAAGMPPNQHPGSLAFAQVYEGIHVVVLFDRIENCAAGPTQVSNLLAHVMTHEITHILQRVSRHSQTGVMKAHWDANDFLQMAHSPLPFAAEDIDLIHRGLSLRAAGEVFTVASAAAVEQH